MSAAIAMAPSPALHERPASYATDMPDTMATTTSTTSTSPVAQKPVALLASGINSTSQSETERPNGTAVKSSPPSANRAPRIFVKKEPTSPEMPPTRHRPRKLDLSKDTNNQSLGTSRPWTSREGLGIREVGIACLSPGLVTPDKEMLQRSIEVREQQRRVIEARMRQQSSKGDAPPSEPKDFAETTTTVGGGGGGGDGGNDDGQFTAKTPGMLSRRNKAPQGLSIVAPSHEQFATERVIQSAPLGQTFTGRHQPPLSRQTANHNLGLPGTTSSHLHSHLPARQTNNRLPPISDVFNQVSAHPDNAPPLPPTTHSHSHPPHSLYPPANRSLGPPASPGFPPPPPSQQQQQQQQIPTPSRPRDYRSAEEAQADLARGRPELLPKLVHYVGHQPPPTPPSPRLTTSRPSESSRSTGKRRTRAEYEDGDSPPLGEGPTAQRRGPFGYGRDSPETQARKKAEFIQLCERAWDLFHS